MLNIALALLQRLGGARVLFFALACLAPLMLWQCGRSSLESLREDYRALESDNAALAASLQACRTAAGLHDAVLTARERETIEITNKYNRLREEFLRALLPPEGPHEQATPAAPEVLPDEALPARPFTAQSFPLQSLPAQSFPDWCAQPVPLLVRGLLANQPANPALP